MKTVKRYDIWFEYSNGSIYIDITLKKAKNILKKLLDNSQPRDIQYFRFFMIKESNSDNYITYSPQTGIVQNLNIIKNPTSRKAIQDIFDYTTERIEKIKEYEDNF